MRRFVPGRVGADVDPLDEAIGRQLVERPVDGGDADLAAIGAKRVEDLLRGQAAVLPPQQLDHRAATAASAAPGEGQSPLGPVHCSSMIAPAIVGMTTISDSCVYSF